MECENEDEAISRLRQGMIQRGMYPALKVGVGVAAADVDVVAGVDVGLSSSTEDGPSYQRCQVR